jgi:transcriptional regulator with XRE-family HTH domain
MSIGNRLHEADRSLAIWQDGLVSFGQRLKDAREARGLKRNALAALAGVDSSAITRWEKEDRSPKGTMVAKLAHALGCSEHWLLTGDGPREPKFVVDEIALPPLGKLALEQVLRDYKWPTDLPMGTVLSIIEKARTEAARLADVDVPESAWRLYLARAARDAKRS